MKTKPEIEAMWQRVAKCAEQYEDGTDDLEAIMAALKWALGEDDDAIDDYLEDQ